MAMMIIPFSVEDLHTVTLQLKSQYLNGFHD